MKTAAINASPHAFPHWRPTVPELYRLFPGARRYVIEAGPRETARKGVGSARDRDSDAAEGGVSGGSGHQDTHRRPTTTTWCTVVCVWACASVCECARV